ncbi:hypothetical protein E2C01_090738 [Portunus trituberculatus]|uniref:Uncharacterized protein n=1 Tax=Portunus trituberculatus TaxID=210409 RepID=A0A5B7JHE5_PORTR|nr:hypothetical protein [Portunus trituberculatus]
MMGARLREPSIRGRLNMGFNVLSLSSQCIVRCQPVCCRAGSLEGKVRAILGERRAQSLLASSGTQICTRMLVMSDGGAAYWLCGSPCTSLVEGRPQPRLPDIPVLPRVLSTVRTYHCPAPTLTHTPDTRSTQAHVKRDAPHK